ncbi:MAG: MBOAT family O-acyltransferase [Schaedlerella sp.]|nr:MBOAT family O-acyltransferase [Schaedlerella sp.]
MLFNSITFIFVFLPVVLAVYYLVSEKYKNIVLLISSLIFYSWGEPIYVVLLILSILFNFFCGRDIEWKQEEPYLARRSLIFAVVGNVLLLSFFKYYGFVMENINTLFNMSIPYRVLNLPIGISFYTFQAISYLIDIYRGKTRAQKSIVKFSVYMAMFPQIAVGPIVRYHHVEEQLTRRYVSKKKFCAGVMYFICGLGKKVILADSMGIVYEQVAALEMGTFSALTAWAGCLAFAFQIYFDFSGYSDMAVGLAKMVGFDLERNFYYPYVSRSITEFWRRWHISLSTWFKEYVYISLGGNRCAPVRHIFNLLIVWILTGCWHGSEWHFIFWGLYYGVIQILEKYVYGAILETRKENVQRTVTMLIILIGWVIFFSPDMGYASRYLSTMFVFGATALADELSLFLIRTNWLLFVVCWVASTTSGLNILNTITNTYKSKSLQTIATCVVYIGIFVLSIAFLVTGEARPFLYFKF